VCSPALAHDASVRVLTPDGFDPDRDQLRTGNGQPGGPHGGSFGPHEMGVSQATATLRQRLDALDIPHLYVDYGPGAHTWPYWRDDLAATLPEITTFFARNPELLRAAV
jgi:S-formylglutathione hydrolase FrmB